MTPLCQKIAPYSECQQGTEGWPGYHCFCVTLPNLECSAGNTILYILVVKMAWGMHVLTVSMEIFISGGNNLGWAKSAPLVSVLLHFNWYCMFVMLQRYTSERSAVAGVVKSQHWCLVRPGAGDS